MSADIDLDFADRSKIMELVEVTPAMQFTEGQIRKNNSGVYPTAIPYDHINKCAAIDYEAAERRGYFKLDFLNMSVYQLIKDQEHYNQMLTATPPWERLWQDPQWAKQLVHVGNYASLLGSMRPDSIPRMAAFISVIRPGKSYLQRKSWEDIFANVWDGDGSQGYTFKRSHAISYAALVALHMNLLNN